MEPPIFEFINHNTAHITLNGRTNVVAPEIADHLLNYHKLRRIARRSSNLLREAYQQTGREIYDTAATEIDDALEGPEAVVPAPY